MGINFGGALQAVRDFFGKPTENVTPLDGQVPVFNALNNQWELQTGGAGENNTSSNVGSGDGIALPKVGVDLPFKSFTAGQNIVLTPSATELAISTVLNKLIIGDSLAGDKILEYTDNLATQTIRVNNALYQIDLVTGSVFKVRYNSIEKIVGDSSQMSLTDLNLIMDGGYAEVSEITEPASPAANKARFWLDPSVIVNDHPRLVLKDEFGVNYDLSASGMVINTFNTESIGSNHYLALSGLNSSNGTFINRAVVLPRATRFYNLYVVVTTNGTTIVTNCALNDGAGSPTILDVDIPIGTTGTFINPDDFVDLPAATEVAYGFGLTTGGTLAIASIGMAMDTLRLE